MMRGSPSPFKPTTLPPHGLPSPPQDPMPLRSEFPPRGSPSLLQKPSLPPRGLPSQRGGFSPPPLAHLTSQHQQPSSLSKGPYAKASPIKRSRTHVATTDDLLPPPQVYRTPIVRIVGPLWRALRYSHAGNLLHDKDARLNNIISKDFQVCSRCGSGQIMEDESEVKISQTNDNPTEELSSGADKVANESQHISEMTELGVSMYTEDVGDEGKLGNKSTSHTTLYCRECGCKNPTSFLCDQRGRPVMLGSIVLCGPHKAPGFVIEMNRGAHTVEALFAGVHGCVQLEQRTLIGMKKKPAAASRWSKKRREAKVIDEKPKEIEEDAEKWELNDPHAKVLMNQRVDELDEDDALMLRRLVMSLAEYSLCGGGISMGVRCYARKSKTTSLYHLQTDILARAEAEIHRALKSVPNLEYSLRGMRVQKSSYLEALRNLSTYTRPQIQCEDHSESGDVAEQSDDLHTHIDHMPLNAELLASRNLDERINLKKKIITTQSMISSAEAKLQVARKVQRPILFSCPRCGWSPWIGKVTF